MKGFPRRGSDSSTTFTADIMERLNEGLPQKGKRSAGVDRHQMARMASMKGFPRRGSDARAAVPTRLTITYASMKGFPRRGSDTGDGSRRSPSPTRPQ